MCGLTLAVISLVSQQPALGDFVFHKVERGDIVQTIVERGELYPAKQVDLVCKLRAAGRSNNIASTIAWLVEDGQIVKKGEVVMKLDQDEVRQRLADRELAYQEAKAAERAAQDERSLTLDRIAHDLEGAKDAIMLAEIDLTFAANEAERRRAEIKVKQAKRAHELAKREAQLRIARADAALAAPQAALKAAALRLDETKADLANCEITAPQDGLVVYYVADTSRFGAGQGGVIAVGENVREGQRLFSIPDLSRMQAKVKIHESHVRQLKPDMPATVEIAGPKLTGKVASVAATASASDWMSSDVKVYDTVISLDADNTNGQLKPGMSATVTILAGKQQNVLRVPTQAVRGAAGRKVCYIKTRTGLTPVEVTTGITNGKYVEIKTGLSEGDEVALNPPPAVPGQPARERGRAESPPPSDLVLRSLRPQEEDVARRSFIHRYGLTEADLTWLREALPDAVLVAPRRHFQAEFRAIGMPGLFNGTLVATTPAAEIVENELLRISEGRFLADADMEGPPGNVAVLGSGVAAALFPGEDPLGQCITLSGKGRAFVVVGVLRQSHLPIDEQVIVPLPAANALLGETIVIRQAGRRGAEQVQISEVTLRFPSPEARQRAAAIVRARLESTHTTKDWAMEHVASAR